MRSSSYGPFLLPKRPFSIGIETCFARISYKSTLYKTQSVCKLYVPGGIISGFRVLLDTIEHAHRVSGPFPLVHLRFVTAFFRPLWSFVTPFQAASTLPRLNWRGNILLSPIPPIYTVTLLGTSKSRHSAFCRCGGWKYPPDLCCQCFS